MNVLVWAIPFFVVTMVLELRWIRARDVQGYPWKDSATNIAMGVGYLLIAFALKAITVVPFFVVYEYRFFEIPTDAWWVWLLLLPAEDFCFYWYHRAGHEIRLLWAAHVNHHSSTTYNLSTALRQPWTAWTLGWIFWMPLVLLGFHPLMVFFAQSLNLLYQYWIHTELIGRMGHFEWLFNSPSHHRVHHGSNPKYLDRNHAGILIIWDRLFGTFAPEEERPTYGLTRNIDSHHPLHVAFHEWRAIARDVRAARTWRGRLGYLFGPPGWREDGPSTTSRILRQRALEAEPQESSTAAPLPPLDAQQQVA